MAEFLLFVRLFNSEARPDLVVWWLAYLATKPEYQDRFSVAHIFSVCFSFLFEHLNAKLLQILVKLLH